MYFLYFLASFVKKIFEIKKIKNETFSHTGMGAVPSTIGFSRAGHTRKLLQQSDPVFKSIIVLPPWCRLSLVAMIKHCHNPGSWFLLMHSQAISQGTTYFVKVRGVTFFEKYF